MSRAHAALLCLAFFFTACSSGSDDDDGPVIEDAGGGIGGLESCVQETPAQTLLCGSAFATDGVTPLVGAEIRASASNAPTSATGMTLRGVLNSNRCLTDATGSYVCVLLVPESGTASFEIVAEGFEERIFEVDVVVSGVNAVEPTILSTDSSIRWAVLTGEYDGVQVLLAQLKGCTLNGTDGLPFNGENPELARGSEDCESKGLSVIEPTEADTFMDGGLNQYDALFVNCETDLGDDDDINAAVRSFSESGKYLYFSDRSDPWLSAVFPDTINFAGNLTDFNGSAVGRVVNPGLASVVGDDIELIFDLDKWTAIDSVISDTTTYIEADISEYTNYAGTKPITVGFKPGDSAGCVFYTSYHIEGASTGSDQELAMKYLIQNIESVC